MKKTALIILAVLAAGTLPIAAQTNTNAASSNASGASLPTTTVVVSATPVVSTNVVTASNTPAAAATNVTAAVVTNDAPEITPTNQVRMNFKDVPLSTVLNYLSARMGFVVNADVDLRGNATIVSEQPIGTNEVLKLLSAALAKNSYSVAVDGRILNITSQDTAKNAAATPVIEAAKPSDIPVTDEMATYVLPVHTLNPTQLIKDLEQLVPTGATVAANEAGNAIIMTARKKDIHRFAEIIAALDGSSVSEVEVFILKYADAKSVADELKEVFQSPDSTVARSDARTRFRGGGFGGFPFGGGGGGGGDNNNSDSKNASNKAVFTSDDQMNAVIASAPPDYFAGISNVIDQLDQPSQEVTMMKVVHLKYVDPQEMADELGNLFPDESTVQNNQNSRSMGFRFMPPWMQPQSTGSAKSQRMTRQTTVRAVPDPRTASIIITASKDMIDQITNVIAELDNDPRGTQREISLDIDHADPATVQAALAALFGPNKGTQPTTGNNNDILTSRTQAAAQSQAQTTTSSSTGLGGTAGVR